MKFLDTIKFLIAAIQNSNKLLVIDQVAIKSRFGEDFQTDVYQPINPKKYKGTILFVHGMNKYGNKDPRMMALCKAAALANYRAVAPTYQLIAEYYVDLRSVDEIVDTIKLIAQDKTLSESGKVGIFTASLSGTHSIRAAANVEVASLVTSICSVGICFNPRTTFTNILKTKSHDRYAKYIAIKSLLHMNDELNETLRIGLDLAIDDEFDENGLQRTKQFLLTLTGEAREQLATFIEAVELERDLSTDYQHLIENIHNKMTAAYDMRGLRCYTTLIHSAEDNVLPTLETVLLYQQLKEYGKQATMLITPILEHADFQFKLSYMIDMIKFMNAFYQFFKHI
ncbi:MAG: hypothetical protein A3E87_03970 [Gammaproteobacteria bacterium RIFCSPHIGHO2_12_FULL_35_23]|nr:MAG: hypothetical protein A3E87_03970 [Gammaproteobacteria bacterium RIFCSPHIGHO2_12_FULL_35_23]